MEQIIGGSFLSELSRRVKGIVTAVTGTRRNLPPAARKVLSQIGDQTIVGVRVGRRPIQAYVKATIDLIRAPKMPLYHLWLELTLDSGKTVILEKNQVIGLFYGRSGPKDETLAVPIAPVRVIDFINNAINAMGNGFWDYSATTTNCQDFAYRVLQSNGVKMTPYESFILQDVAKLLPGWAEFLTKKATDLASKADLVLKGYGQVGSKSVRARSKRQ